MNNLFRTGLIVILGLSFSCTKKINMDEKVLNIVVPAKVKGMDPIYSNDLYSANEVSRVYEGLLEYHYLKRPFVLVPNLAEKMPVISKDGLIYTFKIRENVYFHNDVAFSGGKGRELVADDFVYSIKRLADPKLQSLGWWVLDGKIKGLNEWRQKYSDLPKADYSEEVEGIIALDKYTIRFKLKKKFPQFLYALAMSYTFAVPHEVVSYYGGEFLNHPVGTGPFMLSVFKQSNKIVYKRNPHFRKKLYPSEASDELVKRGLLKDAGKRLPFLDKLVINIITESQPRWLNFQKGRLDYLVIPKDNFDSAITPQKSLSENQTRKGIRLSITPSLDVTYMAFNHDNKFLRENKKVRQAMSLVYDVNESIRIFSNGRSIPAQSVIPPGIAGHIDKYTNPYRGPKINEAKKMLANAGFPNGKGVPEITYDTTSNTTARQGGEFFKKQMSKIGINIRVIQNPWPELQKKILKRNIMMYGIAWSADYPDAENFLQLLYGPNKSPGANGSGYNNSVFNLLYEKTSTMQDSPERTALYEKMNKMIAEEVPWIFGVHRQDFVVYHAWVKNYIRYDFDAGQAQYLDVDLKKKKEILERF